MFALECKVLALIITLDQMKLLIKEGQLLIWNRVKKLKWLKC